MGEQDGVPNSGSLNNNDNNQQLSNKPPIENTLSDDLDLADAIGDVFSNFDFNALNNSDHKEEDVKLQVEETQPPQSEQPPITKPTAKNTENGISNDSESNKVQNLDNAINDIFNDPTDLEPNKSADEVPTPTNQENVLKKENEDLDELDLDNAISNAFEGFFPQSTSTIDDKNSKEDPQSEPSTTNPQSELSTNTELQPEKPVFSQTHQAFTDHESTTSNLRNEKEVNKEDSKMNMEFDDMEDELSKEIGDAFSKIVTDKNESFGKENMNVSSSSADVENKNDTLKLNVSQNHTLDTINQQNTTNQEVKDQIHVPTPETTPQQTNQQDDDFDLDLDAAIGDAIGNAFNDILPPSSKLPLNESQNATTTKAPAEDPKLNDQPTNSEPGINFDDEDLNNLIANSLQQVFTAPREEPLDNNDMKDAITSAFKSAGALISSTNFQLPQNLTRRMSQSKNDPNSLRDLAKEIKNNVSDQLQNEKVIPSSHHDNESQQQPAEPEVLDLEELQMSDILKNAFKMALEEPQEIMDIEIDESLKPKPPQPVPTRIKRVDTTVPSLPKPAPPKSTTQQPKTKHNEHPLELPKTSSFFSNPEMKSQISSVITSLTSRINSGELADSNILTTIRQITEEMASGSGASLFLRKPESNIETLISEFIKSLSTARQFLKNYPKQESNVLEKSIIVVEEMILKFNSDSGSQDFQILSEETEFISAITNLSLSLFLESSLVSKLTPESKVIIDKFKTNSPETKRKIRIGNRERKKKWREENSERNKDNDLKIRVVRKANLEFGEIDTPKKLEWIEEEICRRKAKRSSKPQGEEDSAGDTEIKSETSAGDTEKSDTAAAVPNEKEISQIMINQDVQKSIKDVVYHILSNKAHLTPAILIGCSTVIGAIAEIYAIRLKFLEINMSVAVNRIIKTTLDGGFDYYNTSNSLLNKRHLSEIVNNSKRLKLNQGESSLAKLPVYKPIQTTKSSSIYRPSLQLPRNSPFISNKLTSTTTKSQSSALPRKPGAFSNPKSQPNEKNRGTSLGFPKLFSTSLK
ncbi:hypothetical protein KGF54_004069 [Candida jiufengensis]|uniref:uncharacterized protein n=1 Tax=Candida jiufengensis TaxID=497108 RepID=UPI0022251F6D|nr:uncharacterized protein KGF54_004069 [Candida jiufengensis]KAI5950995.1 hypothetical protein KGF54_004069 [Candida jiufengensis]